MSLQSLGESHGTDKAALGYLPIYERHLDGRQVRSLLEIGVLKGNSLRMWRDFFPGAQIYGLDIDPAAKRQAGERIEVAIGSQDDRRLLTDLAARAGGFDVVIDDGSHVNELTIASYDALWPQTRQVYVIEDLGNSYLNLTPHVGDWPGMEHNHEVNYRNRRVDMDRFFTRRIREADRGFVAAHFYKNLAVFERCA